MKNAVWSVSALVLACGCGSPETESSAAEPVGVVVEPLSFHESCGSISPDATITGTGAAHSPQTYSRVGCAKAYLINLNGYNSPYPFQETYVQWTVPPSNATDCARASTYLYIWDTTGGGSTALLAVAAQGQWVTPGIQGTGGIGGYVPPPYCDRLASFTSGSLKPIVGHSYRYAIAARQGHADGSYATRAFDLYVN